MSRDPADRLRDILERISSVAAAEDVMEQARDRGDERTVAVAFDAILYDLVVIGEAVRMIPADVLAREPEVPWRLIVGMRNRLAHEYFRLRPELVGLTIDEPMRHMEAACRRLLAE